MPKIRNNCKKCGVFVWKHLSLINTESGKVFCSRECFNLDRRNRVTLNCKQCGVDFEVCKSQVKYKSSNYCSDVCGENNGYYRSHKQLYPHTSHLRDQVRIRRNIKNLNDTYIKTLISRNTPLGFEDIPQELIDLKRVGIKRKRKLKQITNCGAK